MACGAHQPSTGLIRRLVETLQTPKTLPTSRLSRLRDLATLIVPEIFQNRFERLDDFMSRDIAFAEFQLEIERFVFGFVVEHVRLRAARFRLREILADLRTCRAALTGDLLDQGGH